MCVPLPLRITRVDLCQLRSQVESRDAATTDVAAIDHCITYDDFCDAHELLLVFTSKLKLHMLLSCSANTFFMMGVCGRLSRTADFPAEVSLPQSQPHSQLTSTAIGVA